MRHSTTEQRHHLRQLAKCILCALAFASLAACGEESPTEPEASGPQVVQPDELAAELTADQRGATPAAAGRPGASATRLPRSFFVNPVTGKDTNAGTKLLPFKTLARGLSTAISGDTLRLSSGVYSAATNGEKFTNGAQQVVVPAGVMILGTLAGDLTTQLHGVSGDGVGLNLQGGATVRNLVVRGFPTGLLAMQGVQSLKNLTLDQNTFGLNLGGSAKATLVGGTIFATPPANPTGDGTGAHVVQQAQFTMIGGTISGGSNCNTTVKGVFLSDAARLTLKNGATIKNMAGTALTMNKTSKATLTGLTLIDRNFSQLPGCSPAPGVFTLDSTTLTMKNVRILGTGGVNSVGILAQSRGLLTLDSTEVIGHTGKGIKTQGAPKIVVLGSRVQKNGVGVDASLSPNAILTITGSTVSSNGIGIHAPFFKLRKSLVTSNQTGILVATFSADLGDIGDPGNNLIAANSITGVTWDADLISGGAGGIFASGNAWNPSTQGSDANGRYLTKPLLNNDSPLASGKNFVLPTIDANDLFQIQL